MSFTPDLLQQYGWTETVAASFASPALQGLTPGRVIIEYNNFYRVITAAGETLAQCAGRLKHAAASRAELPAVGDWVGLRIREGKDEATIQAVTPRHSRFLRKVAGSKTDAQVVAANVDTIFLVTSLNLDFNPRRIERYLASVRESGASPVIVLSKADLCEDESLVDECLAGMRAAAGGAPVHAVSIVTGAGMAELAEYLTPGQTIALAGASGVGKSSLINFFAGTDLQKTREVREHDDRGMHTTTHRQLLLLPGGALALDTPGMREMQLWDADQGVQQTFEDIEALALHCRFSNCQHQNQPGCAVRAALASGGLDSGRYENYIKLQEELQQLAVRQNDIARRNQQKQHRKLSRQAEERARIKRSGKE
ncbi:MAG: ribosome small subunit-dependent GTPase A [Blastocatellia bacterium]